MAEATNLTATKEELLKYYSDMMMIRRFEEKAGQLYGMGEIGGFCHLYIGQEAVVVGMEAIKQEGDQVITGYRDHGHMLACGMDPKGVMAELTGRSDGLSKGKGGSMHMFSSEKISWAHKFHLVQGWHLQIDIAEMMGSVSPILVTVHLIKAKCLKL